jgi:arylsulfatase
MRYSFDAKPDTPTQKHVQYFAMLGSRALWKDGWKAVALHAPLTGKGNFDKDEWEPYNTEVDRAESNNLAKKNPEKLKELISEWNKEAAKNLVLPLDDCTAIEQLGIERPSSEPARDQYIYYPGTASVPEGVAVNVRGRSYKIIADVDIKDVSANGVLFAHGSRFGGHTLFIKNKKLNYVYNFLGIAPEQKFTSNIDITPSKHVFGMEFIREKNRSR